MGLAQSFTKVSSTCVTEKLTQLDFFFNETGYVNARTNCQKPVAIDLGKPVSFIDPEGFHGYEIWQNPRTGQVTCIMLYGVSTGRRSVTIPSDIGQQTAKVVKDKAWKAIGAEWVIGEYDGVLTSFDLSFEPNAKSIRRIRE